MAARTYLTLTGLTLAALIGGCGAKPEKAAHNEVKPVLTRWAYEGDGGPAHWGQLGEATQVCGVGKRQSPIDLTTPSRIQSSQIDFNYQPSTVSIQNSGHSLTILVENGGGLEFDGVHYALRQIQFHTPAEHQIEGHGAAFETQFVHDDGHGHRLIMAVQSDVGAADPMLASIWAYLPATPGPVMNLPGIMINARDLMPVTGSLLAYAGSLTQPPCTEGITWLVNTSRLTLSPEQIGAFSRVLGANARPLQPRNDRDIVSLR